MAPAAPAPTAAIYAGVTDRAELLFSTAAGGYYKVQVPAPVASLFLADQETVDPTAAATIITEAIASVVTPDGTALTAYVAGTRLRR